MTKLGQGVRSKGPLPYIASIMQNLFSLFSHMKIFRVEYGILVPFLTLRIHRSLPNYHILMRTSFHATKSRITIRPYFI